ncbi:MAG: HD domain-containing phosphohydrolase [Bdellovibrionota bacterium]
MADDKPLVPHAYFPVDIRSFRNVTRDISFDVYLKISDDNFAHVFSKTTGLDYKRLAQYIQKGVTQLYVKKEDQTVYKTFIQKPASVVFNDPGTPVEKRIAVLLNMTEQNMAEIFTQITVSEETAEKSQKVIKDYVELMTKTPQTLAIILKLVSHGDYLYYHSIATAIFSMFIAKATGQFASRMLEIVGMGGFIHDIGFTQISKDILTAPRELTESEWTEIKRHPKIGLEMIEATPTVPDEVKYIVYQHHEQPGGRGYPNSIHGPVIYYPAKVVALADAFSALISKRPFRPAYTIEEALKILVSEPGRYDRELVKVVCSVFGKPGETKKVA